jgi:hypothetical protein
MLMTILLQLNLSFISFSFLKNNRFDLNGNKINLTNRTRVLHNDSKCTLDNKIRLFQLKVEFTKKQIYIFSTKDYILNY